MTTIWVLLVFLAAGEVEVHPQVSELACHASALEQERIEAARMLSEVVGVMCVLADVADDVLAGGGLAP